MKRAYAHEVYVLDQNEIARGLAAPRLDFGNTIRLHGAEFFVWGLGAILLVFAIFFISISRPVERLLDPFLMKLKRAAPRIAQTTFGIALFASGYYGAAFGTELPFALTLGSYAPFARGAFMLIGAAILLGIYPRLASALALLLFMPFVARYGWYLTAYAIYFGEALAVLACGEGRPWHQYKFLLLRITFGASLMYAALYAKYLHGALALETVVKYRLTNYFPFDPAFVVLGALIIEILLGLFFLAGFEVRFASLFFLTFLALSLFFFGETVWPHFMLIGMALAMFAHGYDRYSLIARLSGRPRLEPAL